MPTLLEMALLSMDAYEKDASSNGLNVGKGLGNFSLGVAQLGQDGFFDQTYTFGGSGTHPAFADARSTIARAFAV